MFSVLKEENITINGIYRPKKIKTLKNKDCKNMECNSA